MPIFVVMNAIAHASALPLSGPKLDNRRVVAALIDLVVVGAGGALILAAAGALGSDAGERGGALGAVILGWALYYYFACESSGGQTLGKKLLKLRVLRADGGAVGMREVAVRTVLRVVDGVGLYLVGLIVMVVTGERRGRLGDLAAGTIVADASASTVVAEPVAAGAPPVMEPVAQRATVTLPPPVAAPVPELRPFEPELAPEPVVVAEPEPVVEVVEPEPEPEPVVEPDPVVEVVEPEPVAEPVEVAEPDPVAEIASPSLQELARDLAAASASSREPVEDEPAEDEPFVVKPVETVSAIDLVMGGDTEDEAPSPSPDAS